MTDAAHVLLILPRQNCEHCTNSNPNLTRKPVIEFLPITNQIR